MGIRFRCHHCETELHVKDFQGGKRGRCPECKGKFRVPLSDAEHSLEADDSVADAGPVAPATNAATTSQVTTLTIEKQAARDQSITESSSAPPSKPPSRPAKPRALIDTPQAKWFVRPTSGGQYGPAPSESMWQWLGENRIGRDSLVWCDGWPEWLVADEVFDDFFASSPADESLESAPSSLSAIAASDSSDVSDKQNPNLAESTQPTSLSDRNRLGRKHRRRRNYTIMIAILSVVMIALIVALVVVLNNQQV